MIESARDVERVVGEGADRFDAVKSRIEQLRRLNQPALLVPTRVSMVRGDQVVVAESRHDHDALRAILDARGPLRAGECVWVGRGVAAALAALHREGLVHGALGAEAVVVADGHVSLARLVDGEAGASAPDDIAALGRLLALAVRDADADRVSAWVEPMTHDDSTGRPTAAMVARALTSCAPPEELVPTPMGIATALRRAAAAPRETRESASVALPSDSRWWGPPPKLPKLPKWGRRGGDAVARAGRGTDRGEFADREFADREWGDREWGDRERGTRPAVALEEARWWRLRLKVGRWAKRAGLGLLAVVAVMGIVMASARALNDGDDPAKAPLTPASAPLTNPDSPVLAARQLTLSRFAALARGEGVALVALTAKGSPARADAQDMASSLAAGSLRITGLDGFVTNAVLLEAVTPGAAVTPEGAARRAGATTAAEPPLRAVIRVSYRLGPHVIVIDGTSTSYEGYGQTVDLTLTWVDGCGWLVSEVR